MQKHYISKMLKSELYKELDPGAEDDNDLTLGEPLVGVFERGGQHDAYSSLICTGETCSEGRIIMAEGLPSCKRRRSSIDTLVGKISRHATNAPSFIKNILLTCFGQLLFRSCCIKCFPTVFFLVGYEALMPRGSFF